MERPAQQLADTLGLTLRVHAGGETGAALAVRHARFQALYGALLPHFLDQAS